MASLECCQYIGDQHIMLKFKVHVNECVIHTCIMVDECNGIMVLWYYVPPETGVRLLLWLLNGYGKDKGWDTSDPSSLTCICAFTRHLHPHWNIHDRNIHKYLIGFDDHNHSIAKPHASSPFLNKRDGMFHGDHVVALKAFYRITCLFLAFGHIILLPRATYMWSLAILWCMSPTAHYQLASILLS